MSVKNREKKNRRVRGDLSKPTQKQRERAALERKLDAGKKLNPNQRRALGRLRAENEAGAE